MSPALRFGSDRLLVVGLGSQTNKDKDEGSERSYRESGLVLAKVLNALMLDHVDYDIVRLGHVNRFFMMGRPFSVSNSLIVFLNQMVTPCVALVIELFLIWPSVRPEICEMAVQHV